MRSADTLRIWEDAKRDWQRMIDTKRCAIDMVADSFDEQIKLLNKKCREAEEAHKKNLPSTAAYVQASFAGDRP